MEFQRVTEYDNKTLLRFFKPLEFTIAVDALIEGSSEGALWIDDPVNPSIALLWDYSDGVYLVSKEYSEPLHQAIHNLFQKEIIPETEKRTQSPLFVIYAFPSQWGDHISSIFSSSWTVFPETAYFYTRPLSLPNPTGSSDSLSAPFIGQQIDPNLLNHSDLRYLPNLIKTLESDWGSLENFHSHGYGYCVIDEKANSLASWGVTGNIARSCAELGIDTMEEYRGIGLATYVTSQMIYISSFRKYTPHWYCFQENAASVNLAEKLGFQRVHEFLVYVTEKTK